MNNYLLGDKGLYPERITWYIGSNHTFKSYEVAL
jgi:hypothetical protein